MCNLTEEEIRGKVEALVLKKDWHVALKINANTAKTYRKRFVENKMPVERMLWLLWLKGDLHFID